MVYASNEKEDEEEKKKKTRVKEEMVREEEGTKMDMSGKKLAGARKVIGMTIL